MRYTHSVCVCVSSGLWESAREVDNHAARWWFITRDDPLSSGRALMGFRGGGAAAAALRPTSRCREYKSDRKWPRARWFSEDLCRLIAGVCLCEGF